MFIETVQDKFSFLENTYGFTLKKKTASSTEYTNGKIDILIGWYKGEVDIDVYVRIESDIFKPYLSRIFRLIQIIKYVDPKAIKNAPQFPNYITSDADCYVALAWGAKMMKSVCDPILRGDLRILEEITRGHSRI
jgi:hypothetical protein